MKIQVTEVQNLLPKATTKLKITLLVYYRFEVSRLDFQMSIINLVC